MADDSSSAAPAAPAAPTKAPASSGAMSIESSAWLTAAAVAIYSTRVLWMKLKRNTKKDHVDNGPETKDQSIEDIVEEDEVNWDALEDEVSPVVPQSDGLMTTQN